MSNQPISVFNPIGDLLHIWRCDGDDIIDITTQHTQALEAAGNAVDMFH